MLEKIQKWLTDLVIKHYNKTELDSEESQVKALRRYLQVLSDPNILDRLVKVPGNVHFLSQFKDIEHLHKKIVSVRQALDNDESLHNIYSSSGKTNRFTKEFLTIANGVYIQPEYYFPNIINEINAVLTHMEKLRAEPKTSVQRQNEYILKFLISDMIEMVKHFIQISAN